MRLTYERLTLIKDFIADGKSHPIIGNKLVEFLKELIEEIDSTNNDRDIIDEMQENWDKWAPLHNRDNYGRFDAFRAGYLSAMRVK